MGQTEYIRLGHGSGGKLTHSLITELFLKHFDNEILQQQGDAGLLPSISGKQAFSTDAYVIDPLFFPGGNIGSLAVSGTVNDIAVTGAVPHYLSAAFIIEEGFAVNELEEIVRSMAETAHRAGIRIIAGDTKVVNKGKCDKLFITTAGVGSLDNRLEHIASGSRVRPGDRIIINGYVGDHATTILGERESLKFSTPVASDACCLNSLIAGITKKHDIHFMRDATRGGLATVLAELAQFRNTGIRVQEESVPVRDEVRGICEIFGYDPLYMANEGKVVVVAPESQAEAIVSAMRRHTDGKDASIIGSVTGDHPGKVILDTEIGGRRFLDMLSGEQLPRIC